ncbi:acyltransferase family protein [Nocardiopsis sp. RSe5-2]|uniref:Acyltransferase family protein n=1 Tax=Nocardiopsis endophytica TaxID=3018445 RepID=A0ABT4U9S8_9ACTN|nr:acyltransferase family protein [Nocardiopsis endophytica]MDA2813723.1 acyltransferase family protein [Nocardiopsis endophytica]
MYVDDIRTATDRGATAVGAGTAEGAVPRPAPPTAWIDLARVAAMGAVVLIHAYSPLVTEVYTGQGSTAWWTSTALDAALRWCVPVFVMISGALLLSPRDETAPDFYRKRWARIGVPLVVWTAAYLAWEMWRTGLTPSGAVEQAASGEPAIHLYFLYIIAGLYVFTPFLRTLVGAATRSALWWFAGAALAFGALNQALGLIEGVGGTTAAAQFLPYVGYYVLGWLLFHGPTGRRPLRLGLALLVAGSAAAAVGAGALAELAGEWGAEADYVFDFLSPAVIAAAIGAFLVLREAGLRLAASERRTAALVSRTARWAAGPSFGVYLVHVMVLFSLRDLFGMPAEGPWSVLAAAGYAAVVTAVSLLLVEVLRRIPFARAVV